MATFYPQWFSNVGLLEQWQSFLKNKPLIHNIEDIVKNQTKDFNKVIENASKENAKEIEKAIQNVCGSIETGFDFMNNKLHNISNNLNEITDGLDKMFNLVDWRLSEIIEQNRIANIFLGNISILLKIPDIQKERQDYIEKGLKFYYNSYYDNDLYENSLKYFLKAEEIEPEDYFTLHHMGLIYFYSPKHFSLTKAEHYFKTAAKYALVEINANSSISRNYLKENIKSDLNKIAKGRYDIQLQAAESIMFGGRVSFLKEDFKECIEQTNKAFILDDKLTEAVYLKMQALVLENKINEALEVMIILIEKDKTYLKNILEDPILIYNNEIRQYIFNLKKSLQQKIENEITIYNSHSINNSVTRDEIQQILKLFGNHTIISYLNVLELFNQEKDRSIEDINSCIYAKEFYLKLNELKNSFLNSRCKYSFKKFYDPLFEKLTLISPWDFPTLVRVNLGDYSSYYKYKINSGIIYDPTDHAFIAYILPKKIKSNLNDFIIKEQEFYTNINNIEIIQEIETTTKKFEFECTEFYKKLNEEREKERINEFNAKWFNFGTFVWGCSNVIGIYLGSQLGFTFVWLIIANLMGLIFWMHYNDQTGR